MPDNDREWGSAQCTNLERLEDFVRQFVGQAPTHMFVKTLLVLEAADQKAATQASKAGEADCRSLSSRQCNQSLGLQFDITPLGL